MMGVDLTYECINNCTIRVHLRAYRDCTGSNSIGNNITFTSQTPGCGQPTAVTAWSPQATQEVTPLCPGAITSCTTPGQPINGVQEFYWFRDYDICSVPNCIFAISWTGCCRNPAITSLSSPGSQSITTNATTLNTNIIPCNSSPQFVNPPVPYICAGQPYTFNQGAYDPEGDSLVYSLGPCFNSGATQVTYNGGFSQTAPLGPSWSVTINSATGDIFVVPQPGNIVVGVFCVYVQEYRNGILINTIVRDIQMTVLNCPANNLPSVNQPAQVVGGSSNGFTITTCVNSSLQMNLATQDLNPGNTVTTWWSQNLPGATFTLLGNPLVQDTLTGTPGNPPVAVFSWTPTATGTYSFLITTRDDACPIVGQNQFTITIIVGNLEGTANLFNNGCGTVTLCADSLTGIGPYQFVWSGPGGLTTNPQALDSCITNTYPATGTYDWFLQITDSNGCIGGDTGTVSVTIAVFPDAGLDQFICSGGQTNIGSQPLPNYTYSWSPTTGLGAPNASLSTVTLTNNTLLPIVHQYLQTATDNSTGCSSIDTVLVTVWPQMTLTTSQVATSCFGGSDGTATANIVGGMNPLAYHWNAAANNQTTQTATGLSAGLYSVVVADSAGCVVTGNVTVLQPSPVSVIAGGFDASCFGASDGHVTASASGGTGPYTYSWLPINLNGPVINGLPAGTYNVTAIDANGCTATATATVNEPTQIALSLVSTPTSCALALPNGTAGVTATGGTPSYTYNWSDVNAQTTQQAVGLAAGNYSVTVTDANGCSTVGSVTVGNIPPPTVSVGPNVAFCEGEGGAAIEAFAASGTPGYWYTWWCQTGNCGLSNINSNNPNANPTVTQWYYVQVTDTNGCVSNIDSVLVTVLPKPIVNAGPDIYLCGDSAPCQILNPVITNASGPYTYQWFAAAGLNNAFIANPCARPDTTTPYTLVVTAGNGCTSDFTTTDTLSTVIVHVNPIPVADAGPDRNICAGDSVMLQGIGSGAGPLYNYEWSPFTGLSSLTDPNPWAAPPITTDYTLVVWSNGCPSYGDHVMVNVHTNPTVNGGPDREMCLGDDIMLDAQAGGDSTATYTYFWTPNLNISSQTDEDPTVNPVSTTMYYVQAVTNFGCESPMDSVLVSLLSTAVANAGPNQTICGGNEVQLNGSYDFATTDPRPANEVFQSWTPGATLSDTTILDPIGTPSASGYYHLMVWTGTCVTYDSVFITVIPELDLQITADTTVMCEGLTTNLVATSGLGGIQFVWSPTTGLGDPLSLITTASPTETTTYTLIGNEGGCYDTASITINVLPTPEMGYLSSGERGCAPHSVSFMQAVANGIFYSWNFGDGTPISNETMPSHVYDQAGTFNVSLTAVGAGGCEATINTINVVVAEPPVAEFHSTPAFPIQLSLPNTQVGFINDSEHGLSYRWDFGDGQLSSEINPSHSYFEPGEYQVSLTVTNEEGCVSSVMHGPYIVLAPDLFIPNVFSPNGDGVNDLFFVNYTGSQPFNAQVFDRWGVKLYESRNKVQGWDGNDSEGNAAPDGVYYYIVKVGDKSYNGAASLLR
jgi:gliding motility-associated-like protein